MLETDARSAKSNGQTSNPSDINLFLPLDVPLLGMRWVSFIMKRGLLITNLLLGFLFAAFAVLQVNDTNPDIYHRPSVIDAWSWVIFYAFTAVLFWVAAFRLVSSWLLSLGMVFCVYQLVTTAPGLYDNLFNQGNFDITGSSMAPKRSHVELSREFLGALIALVGLSFMMWQSRERS